MSSPSETHVAGSALIYPETKTSMRFEPTDKSLSSVAAQLDAGQSVSVCLQPGDGTRYDLLIVPLWADAINSRALGYASETRRETLLVFNAQDCSKMVGVAIERGGMYDCLRGSGAYWAAWSVMLLEWWFEAHLWPRLDAVRGARSFDPRGQGSMYSSGG